MKRFVEKKEKDGVECRLDSVFVRKMKRFVEKKENDGVECRLDMHGVAASSSSHTMTYYISNKEKEEEVLAFSSHCVINLATTHRTYNNSDEFIHHVTDTLCTSTISRNDNNDDTTNRVITALTCLHPNTNTSNNETVVLACGYSDGTIVLWSQQSSSNHQSNEEEWNEHILIGQSSSSLWKSENSSVVTSSFPKVSITDLDGVIMTKDDDDDNAEIMLMTVSSMGVHVLHVAFNYTRNSVELLEIQTIGNYTAASVQIQQLQQQQQQQSLHNWIMVVGTASPRHNKIHVYTATHNTNSIQVQHFGALTGHLDWITCLSFYYDNDDLLLASGSQDARIRLWRFHKPYENDDNEEEEDNDNITADNNNDDNMDNDRDDDDFLEEGEARLHISFHDIDSDSKKHVMAITLEALLIGHEEAVTGISWKPKTNDEQKPCLISSSMDRTIFIWMADNNNNEVDGGGVWEPVSRVGSAGGILGGSVGSSLLGFVDIAFSPINANIIVGHGYGGSLHFWTTKSSNATDHVWNANPGITGHFRGVMDLDWEVTSGQYLLSVGLDQTCRLWYPVKQQLPKNTSTTDNEATIIWMEVGRPQVHGYDLNALVCIGLPAPDNKTTNTLHRIVTGADEKEIRVFDAPLSTLRLLERLNHNHNNDSMSATATGVSDGNCNNFDNRVERAYIPSLGLSNRATAADAMEEGRDTSNDNVASSTNDDFMVTLPNERDLGVASLWPEIQKLFGHQTELVCLASNASSTKLNNNKQVIVASSCKARDIENASIRLWNVDTSSCIQLLKGGHRSTVTTLAFSPNGKYLASSGKDRRLCLWKNHNDDNDTQSPPNFSIVSAIDSAHKRIVWSIHFCPFFLEDDKSSDESKRMILASGSRDGFVKIWSVHSTKTVYDDIVELYQLEPMKAKDKNINDTVATTRKKVVEPITAVAFAPIPHPNNQSLILAIGLECGRIELWSIHLNNNNDDNNSQPCQLLMALPHSYCHTSSIKKLVWRPTSTTLDDNGQANHQLTLASCGLDHGVRIFTVNIDNGSALVKT